MELAQAQEDYLEAILILTQENCTVRCSDIAKHTKRSKATVSVVMKKLEQLGYLSKNKNSEIFLTPKGKKLAKKVYERHCVLKKYFIQIGISEEAAERDACAIEHLISDESYWRLKEYLNMEVYDSE